MALNRRSTASRVTKETEIAVSLDLDGSGSIDVSTSLPFFDHMLAQVVRFSGVDLSLKARGDVEVDAHHVVEDVGIVVGGCVLEALGDHLGIERFAQEAVPMDEALAVVTLDVSGRPYLFYEDKILIGHSALGVPGFDPQLAEEFFRAFCIGARVTLHVDYVRGKNTHHMLEAGFKAFGRALGKAVKVVGETVPSTKGVI